MNLIFGFATSSSAVLTSHKIGLALSLFSTIISFFLLLDNARKPCGRGYGPVLLSVFAAPLILANPLYNLQFDQHLLTESHAANVALNAATWLGVAEMLTASLWNASVDHKILLRLPRLRSLFFNQELSPNSHASYVPLPQRGGGGSGGRDRDREVSFQQLDQLEETDTESQQQLSLQKQGPMETDDLDLMAAASPRNARSLQSRR
eukprot:gb/GEZN01014615.1/.p1 GENE.gb/GEZN01014615.1/~~gb/GEZN01014615.1/.p1  ORF type:complete len:206 (+),score=25.12 gb/GEZN01014615.1/:156-773(+)